MECKSSSPSLYLPRLATELIDTLWNVNHITSKATYLSQYELIDTLWNVNTRYYNYNEHSDGN